MAISDPSEVKELKLLKAQVYDVVRVCNAVARGDLSQMVTVPAQGPVMLQDAVNTMVIRYSSDIFVNGPPQLIKSFTIVLLL